MNKQRRRMIERVIAGISRLPTDELELLKENIEEVQEAEQEAYDNLPESMQNSDRGEAMQEAINHLVTAVDAIGEMIEAYEKLVEALEAART